MQSGLGPHALLQYLLWSETRSIKQSWACSSSSDNNDGNDSCSDHDDSKNAKRQTILVGRQLMVLVSSWEI